MPRTKSMSPSATRRRRKHDLALFSAHAGPAVESLSQRENVAYVTVGQKRVAGVPTGEVALVVYVTKKGDPGGEQRIPDHIVIDLPGRRQASIATDVIELPGRPQLLGIRAGHRIRAPDNDFGTCGLCFTHAGADYVITNSHVVSNLSTGGFPGESFVQDPGTLQLFQIGRTIYMTPISSDAPTDEDYAVIRADPASVSVDPLGVSGEARPVAAISNFSARPSAQYWYSVNGAKIWCASPERVPKAMIDVDRGTFVYVDFWQLQVSQGAVAPGHSGALICTGSGANITACGLLFGGVPPSYVFAFPMDDVLARATQRLGGP